MIDLTGYKVLKDGTVIGKNGGVLKPSVDRYGYKSVNVSGRTRRVHTLVAEVHMNHTLTDGYCIDHINSNKLDNRVENLRIISVRDNATIDKVNTSTGLLGVYFREKSSVYESQIRINGNKTYLGSYGTSLEAHLTYLGVLASIDNNDSLS